MECGHVGVLTVDLHLPVGASLKAKRKELLRVKSALVRRFSCAVAEVDHHELWQRSRLTVAIVSRSGSECEQRLADVSGFLQEDELFQVVGEAREIRPVDADADAVSGAEH